MTPGNPADEVEAEAEHRVHDEALKPRGGRGLQAHGRLHDEEGRRDGADANH